MRYVNLTGPTFVMKRGPRRGRRHRPSDKQNQYDQAHPSVEINSKKAYDTIHHRFVTDTSCRGSQERIGWTEQLFQEMQQLGQEDHSYVATRQERERCDNHSVLVQSHSMPKYSNTFARRLRQNAPRIQKTKEAVMASDEEVSATYTTSSSAAAKAATEAVAASAAAVAGPVVISHLVAQLARLGFVVVFFLLRFWSRKMKKFLSVSHISRVYVYLWLQGLGWRPALVQFVVCQQKQSSSSRVMQSHLTQIHAQLPQQHLPPDHEQPTEPHAAQAARQFGRLARTVSTHTM